MDNTDPFLRYEYDKKQPSAKTQTTLQKWNLNRMMDKFFR